eukprot:106707_1
MTLCLLICIASFFTNLSRSQCYLTNHSNVISNPIANDIVITNHEIEINFDIQFQHSSCDSSLCDIFYIGDENVAYPALYISGTTSHYVLAISTDINEDIHYIQLNDTNASDASYNHNIVHAYFYISSSLIIYQIDDIAPHYSALSHNVTNVPLNMTHSLRINSNTSIKNLCISSAHDSLTQSLNCGSNATTLMGESHVHHYPFNADVDGFVMFNLCGSHFDAQGFVYAIGNPSWNIYNGPLSGICYGRMYLYSSANYLLFVKGTSDANHHTMAALHVQITCMGLNSLFQCGSWLWGTLSSSLDVSHWYFEVAKPRSAVGFDPCGSTFNPHLTFYRMTEPNTVYEHDAMCNGGSVPISNVAAGGYMFMISNNNASYYSYQISVSCSDYDTVMCHDTIHGQFNAINTTKHYLFSNLVKQSLSFTSCEANITAQYQVYSATLDLLREETLPSDCNKQAQITNITVLQGNYYVIKITNYDNMTFGNWKAKLDCSAIEQVTCGDTLHGVSDPWDTFRTDYYVLNTPIYQFMLLSSCKSSPDTEISFTLTFSGNPYPLSSYEYCRTSNGLGGGVFSVPLNAGNYLLQTLHYTFAASPQEWEIEIICPTNNSLKCGDSFEGNLISKFESAFYFFAPSLFTKHVLFDACQSDYAIQMALYDGFLNIKTRVDGLSCEVDKLHLLQPYLDAGEYILSIDASGYQAVNITNKSWRVNIDCSIDNITCGDTLTGYLESGTKHYVLFDASIQSVAQELTVFIDFCGSEFDAELDLYVYNGYNAFIFDSHVSGDGLCGAQPQHVICAGEVLYLLSIEGADDNEFGKWQLHIDCNDLCSEYSCKLPLVAQSPLNYIQGVGPSDLNYYFFKLQNKWGTGYPETAAVWFDVHMVETFIEDERNYDISLYLFNDNFKLLYAWNDTLNSSYAYAPHLPAGPVHYGQGYILGIAVADINNISNATSGTWRVVPRCYASGVQCDHMLPAHLSGGDDGDRTYIWPFNPFPNQSILINTCELDSSNFILHLRDIYGIKSIEVLFTESMCDGNGLYFIPYLPPASNPYELSIAVDAGEDSGSSELQIACSSNNLFKFQFIKIGKQSGWLDAQTQCMNLFGTALATVKSSSDLEQARQLIYQQIELTDAFTVKSVYVFIGLFQGINEHHWRFVDASSCDDDCIINPSVSDQLPGYAYLMVPKHGQIVTSKTLNPFDPSATANISAALCNVPTTENAVYCEQTINCWNVMECCDDIVFHDINSYRNANYLAASSQRQQAFSKLNPSYFQPSIACWDSTLFVVGMNFIQYTTITIPNTPLQWDSIHYTDYLHEGNIDMTSQWYIQYESSLWYQFLDSVGNHKLMHLNLSNLEMISYRIPYEPYVLNDHEESYNEWDICLVADSENVYITTPWAIYIFNAWSKEWHVKSFFVADQPAAACSLDPNHDFIYYFPIHDTVIHKYDLNQEELTVILDENICYSKKGRVVKHRNNKAYVHGCYISSWTSLIFDFETESFATEQIDINGISEMHIPYYHTGQLAVFDDNIVLLLYTTDTQYPFTSLNTKSESVVLYYAVTDMISINFDDTENSNAVWPSDGFNFKYLINDFANTSDTYRLWIFSDNIAQTINDTIVLNTVEDACNCNEIGYKCFGCEQHFNLWNHLTVEDNNVNSLQFHMTAHVSETNITLILSDVFTINLQRCSISFTISDSAADYNDNAIKFTYDLSQNCYDRVAKTFSISVIETHFDIHKDMLLTIEPNHISYAEVCGQGSTTECNVCSNNECSVNINDDEMEAEKKNAVKALDLQIESHSIDLFINTTSAAHYGAKYTRQTFLMNMIGGIVGGVFLLCVIGFILMYLCKRKEREKAEQERNKYVYLITNPMVIFVGVAEYDDKIAGAGVDVICKPLYGIDRDFSNINRLCTACNYNNVFPTNEKFKWTQQEMVDFLKQKAVEIARNAEEQKESELQPYDALFVVVSGHGYQQGIVSSDYQLITKQAIHRLFTTNHPICREIPRIFLFDCCAGDQQRSIYPASFNDDDDESASDAGKNFDVSNIRIEQYDNEIWKSDQRNPDYRLATIHAANDGFQSKMNSVDGSYLIYEFVKRMTKNIEDGENKFLGEIIEEIQYDLHDKGKQQITFSFNNHTRYLMFKKNVNSVVTDTTHMIEMTQMSELQ